EDGIRDFHVTGVQTCALPISRSELVLGIGSMTLQALPIDGDATAPHGRVTASSTGMTLSAGVTTDPGTGSIITMPTSSSANLIRSEERRVGKERSARGSPGPR